jgi:DNA-binding GntR family transcriptional regulator
MPDTQRTTRAEDAYKTIKDEIRSNRLPPGYQSPEPEMSARFGISRTTLREALIRLEAEGLMEMIPRRGARVLPVRADDMKEIYEILMSLEPDAAAGLAASKPAASDLSALETFAETMETALKDGDLDRWAEADDGFHTTVLDLHGNMRLKRFVMTLNDQVHRARMITLRLRDLPVASNIEHQEIIDCMRKGDAEATRTAFRQHRQRAANEIIKILVESGIGQL